MLFPSVCSGLVETLHPNFTTRRMALFRLDTNAGLRLFYNPSKILLGYG
jgi:hypothetical protein